MIQVGMFSAAGRRSPEVLHQTLDALSATEWDDVRLYLDDGRYGGFSNYNRATIGLLEGAEPHDHVLALQDDMVPCKYARRIAERATADRPDAVHVLYTAEQNIPHDKRGCSGWVGINPGWHGWGGLFVIPAWIGRQMVAHDFWQNHLHNYEPNRQTDACTFETLKLMGVPIFTHVPSLFQHIGTDSTVGHTHNEGAQGYRYNEWNQ